MKRRQLIKHLRAHGRKLLQEGGRHSRWWHPERRTRTSVPRHTKINNITAQKICKVLGIPRL